MKSEQVARFSRKLYRDLQQPKGNAECSQGRCQRLVFSCTKDLNSHIRTLQLRCNAPRARYCTSVAFLKSVMEKAIAYMTKLGKVREE